MMAWLLARLWPIVGATAVAVSVWLGFLLINEKAETRHLNKVNAQLSADNKDLVASLAQARTNFETVRTALDELNGQILTLSRAGATRVANAEKKVAAAQAGRADAERDAAAILRHKPQGTTAGDRLLDVDRQFLETLK